VDSPRDQMTLLPALGVVLPSGSKLNGHDHSECQLNAHVAPDVTRADAINVTIPSLGVLTGAGTICPNGALDFSMMADLQTNRSEARAEKTGRGGDREVSPSRFKGQQRTRA